MWERITNNINGHRVSKTIYGTIIILVVILAMGVLLFYGYVASRLVGHDHLLSFLFAVGVSIVGVTIVLFKEFLGH